MELVNTFWKANHKYNGVKEFYFESSDMSFVAFFKDENLLFIIDSTCDSISSDNFLIIEPTEGENPKNPQTKWDSILKNKFKINPIDIRPKENTKYKKLDISYASLDIYASFVSFPSEELLDIIQQNREILSLDNAYEREAENLLIYNKSGTTVEKANITLTNLKKKILNISKKLQNQKTEETTHPNKVDENKKAELIQKLYIATEKLKRTERRIKRANKRFNASFNLLSSKRVQIREIQRKIDERVKIDIDLEQEIQENKSNNPDNILINNNEQNQIVKKQTEYIQTEQLTIPSNNATNRDKEIKEQVFSIEENDKMVKNEDNKNQEMTQEFKPPFNGDSSVNNTSDKSSGIRFADKNNISFDDKHKKIWTYSLSIVASLAVVFGIFYFINKTDPTYVGEDGYNTTYTEQVYTEPGMQYQSEEMIEQEFPPYQENYETYDSQVMSDYYPETETSPEYVPAPVVKPAPEPVYVRSATKASTKKAPAKKASVKKASKKASTRKVAPKPVQDEVIVYEETTAPKETMTTEEVSEMISYTMSMVHDAIDTVKEVVENRSEEDMILEDYRADYYDNVILDDIYLEVVNEVRTNFFNDSVSVNDALMELDNMNTDWNTFRNITYDTYYENDYTLRSDINYEDYTHDEYLLRLYSNAYFELYEYLINEFVMTYEYANSTAADLYEVIEAEMEILGRPNTKLLILMEAYYAIQGEGGSEAVLNAIAIKNEEEIFNAPETGSVLIPLQATSIIIEEDLVTNDFLLLEGSEYIKENNVLTEELTNQDGYIVIEEQIVYTDEIAYKNEVGEGDMHDGAVAFPYTISEQVLYIEEVEKVDAPIAQPVEEVYTEEYVEYYDTYPEGDTYTEEYVEYETYPEGGDIYTEEYVEYETYPESGDTYTEEYVEIDTNMYTEGDAEEYYEDDNNIVYSEESVVFM